MLDKYITAELVYRDWNAYIDIYKRDDIINSIEVTEEVVECMLHYWTFMAKQRLEWEVSFSHPTSEYIITVKKKDDYNII